MKTENDPQAETDLVRALSPKTIEEMENRIKQLEFEKLQLFEECAKLRGHIQGYEEGRKQWNQPQGVPYWVSQPTTSGTYPLPAGWTTNGR